VIRARYGNLFEMYERITAEDPYKVPMRIYPAMHFTMGGLWVDYNLMSTIPGLFVAGEANFSDHGANPLGASALMQTLADGYFIAPCAVADYVGRTRLAPVEVSHPSFATARAGVDDRMQRLLRNGGTRSVDSLHRELGQIMWQHCGMARNDAGLRTALAQIPALRADYWKQVRVLGDGESLNQSLEKALRVADYMELGELLAVDALRRTESCGAHFREESQTPEGEAKRDDANFSYVAAWEFTGVGQDPVLHKEPLAFETVHPAERSYK
jgi:succinate dehydrogenase flavoprotein subunit